MDKRHKRRSHTGSKIEAAIERLRNGQATHPLHIGIQVRVTKQAVAREARVSSATLYRFPELVKVIDATLMSHQIQRVSQSEQRRRNLLARIVELERQNNQLLAENLRLTRELAVGTNLAPTLVARDLNERRARRVRS
ncbi:MAG TPA: hypothetical protein VME66_11990 [Candidatus Acidoferrales bacterium]|nr:hypothetical protein [Candidatus Acidoferrales bacterium]